MQSTVSNTALQSAAISNATTGTSFLDFGYLQHACFLPTYFRDLFKEANQTIDSIETYQAFLKKIFEMFEKLELATIILSKENRIVYANDAYLKLTNKDCTQIIDKFYSDSLPLTDASPATPNNTLFPQAINITGHTYKIHSFSLDIKNTYYQMSLHFFEDVSTQRLFEAVQAKSKETVHSALVQTVQAIAQTLEQRDPYTAGHQKRVAILARAIGQELGYDTDYLEGLHFGGLIHDVGKIQVPSDILSRPGKLRKEEFDLIKLHPASGYEIIKGINFPWPVGDIVYQHHERLNGSGYPQGLKSDAICYEAKILAVADVTEAMCSHRPYRPSLGIEAALQEIEKNANVLYDPQAVNACLHLFRNKQFTLPTN